MYSDRTTYSRSDYDAPLATPSLDCWVGSRPTFGSMGLRFQSLLASSEQRIVGRHQIQQPSVAFDRDAGRTDSDEICEFQMIEFRLADRRPVDRNDNIAGT